MKGIIYILIIQIVFLFGCTKKEEIDKSYTVTNFEWDNSEAIEITGKKFIYPNILTPRRIINVDGQLIVSELSSDTLLHVINKNNLEYVYGFGKEGMGPNEYYKIWNLYPSSNDNSLWIYCPEIKKSIHYDLLNKEQVYSHKQIAEDVLAVQFAPTFKNTFLGIETDGIHKFSEFSSEGIKSKGFGLVKNYLPSRKDIPKNVITSVHQGQLRANPDLDKFGLACLQRDMIEILDLKDSSILSIRGPINQIPEFEVDYSAGYPMALVDSKKTNYCYMNMYMGDEFIYGLFSGENMAQIIDHSKETPFYLFVFNYKGDFIKSFKLSHSILDLVVDEEKDIAYGISNDENPGIVKFTLK